MVFLKDLVRKKRADAPLQEDSLARCLSMFDLFCLSLGAIIGAGIFILTGIVAATSAGPAVVLSYVIAGLACGFSALSYAELAASVGGCGSAYGYAYAGFGELIAWIVGWDLLLEYAISVSAIAVGWSGYFNELLLGLHLHLPLYLLQGPLAHGIIDCLALCITLLLTGLLILGIESSSRVNMTMVLVKLFVIVLFLVVSFFDINPKNWIPFSPFGWTGVMKGASLIFFAYIGFDAASTAAEEMINPERDIPRGIIGALIVCTLLYILVAGTLTGMVSYKVLNVSSPISHALLLLGHKTVAGFIGVGAVAGLTTVMLVMFYGLSRVFLAMSRDGLLPKYFSVLNKKTKTPIRILVPCGLLLASIASFVPLNDLAELVNIGTLFAFSIVCGGVIVLRHTAPDLPRPFKTPFMPYVPIFGIASCTYLMCYLEWVTILRFIIWMVIGLIIYFSYSRFHSVLRPEA